MIRQHFISLNPCGLQAVKITNPPIESPRQEWKLLPMRFIPHDGRAKA